MLGNRMQTVQWRCLEMCKRSQPKSFLYWVVWLLLLPILILLWCMKVFVLGITKAAFYKRTKGGRYRRAMKWW
jgi:membrane-associated PAP2 superfamily phosphatase